jgi:hypothetical protein
MKQSKPEISTSKTSSQPKQIGAKAAKSSTSTSTSTSSKSGTSSVKTKSTGGLGKSSVGSTGGSSVRGTTGSIGGGSSVRTSGSIGGTSGVRTSGTTGTSGSTKQTGSIGTGTTGTKGGNSISFGAVNFDSQQNLLKVRTTQGNSQILCCITGDALRECFHAGTSAQDLEKTFHQHEKEIQYCAQQKIQNKQWKIPNQEILLNTQDLREYTK